MIRVHNNHITSEGDLKEILVDTAIAVKYAANQIEEELGIEAAHEYVSKKLPELAFKKTDKHEGWHVL